MTDVYDILKSIPHNPHYLIRYFKFINSCRELNSKLSNTVFEKHHICPKAKDMFPEYKSFSAYPWNKVLLTPRQHFIAHLLLYKTYTTSSTLYSFIMMCRLHSNSKLYESSKLAMKGLFIAIDKQGNYHYVNRSDTRFINGELQSVNKNKVVVKNHNNKIFQTNTDNPDYLSGDLVSVNKGKTVYIDTDGNKKSLATNHPEVTAGVVSGHTKGMAVMRDENNNILSVPVTDPRIATGNLVGINKGKITINNGKQNRRIYATDIIPEGCVRGMLRPNGPKGKIWITNGTDSKMIKPDESIPDGWKKGRTVNKIWIHNFYESRQLDKNLPIPVGWTKGMAPS